MKTTQQIPRALWSFLFTVGLFVAPGFVDSAIAKTYYVDNNLSSDCTSGNYSITKRACGGSDGTAWNTIQEAVNKINPGDVILVRQGTYKQAVFIQNGNSGTAAAYKTIKTYNGESVVWKGTGTSSDRDNYPLRLTNVSFWQIGDIGAGFLFSDPESDRCISAITNSKTWSVTCEGQGGVTSCGLKIIGNTFDNCASNSSSDVQTILVSANTSNDVSRGHLIKGNTITNFSGQAISIRRSRNSVVEENIIDNAGSTKHGGAGIACTNPECVFNTIRFNIVRNLGMSSLSKDKNPSGIWLDWQASDNLISSNIVHTIRGGNPNVHNGRGIFLEARTQRNTVTNNLVYNAGTGYTGPSGPGGAAVGNVIENNKFVNNTNYGICLTNTKRHIVRNNNLTGNGRGALLVVRPGSYSSGTPLTGSDKPKFENNIWPTGTGKVANLTYQEASGKSICYAAPDRSVTELERVATSESAREGVGEQGALARREDPLSDADLADSSPPSKTILSVPGELRLGSN